MAPVRGKSDMDRKRVIWVQPGDIVVKKARIGWWVSGEWCPTVAIRDFRIERLGGNP